MKINYFITHFPYMQNVSGNYSKHYKHGGAELAGYYLALKTAKMNKVNVFTTSIDSNDSFEIFDNINIYRFGTKISIEQGNFSPKLFYEPLKHDCDVIHTHFSTPPAELAALLYVKKKNTPFVVTYHGDLIESFGGLVRKLTLSLYNKYLVKKVLSNADAIISPSEHYIKNSRFLKNYIEKIFVIPNGIDIDKFNISITKKECRKKLHLPLKTKIILFVGDLIEHKRPEILVKAMKIIIEEIPDVKLIFIGDGKLKNELEYLSRKLELDKHIIFTGFIKDVLKKVMYYTSADVFCLPSATEVFPLTLLEASAAGLPMVVSDLDTFKSIINNGYNGIISKGNAMDIAYSIKHLLENEDLREKIGKNAKERVKNYSWELIAKETEKLYNEVSR